MGQHPWTRDDIRKRWNDLRGKVRSVAARHQIAVQRTGGRPPPPSPQLPTWEEQVLAIMHPEGLAGVGGGLDSGPPANVTREEVPATSIPPTEEAHSDDSSSGRLDLDDQPGPSGIFAQSVTLAHSHTTTEPPPSGNTSTVPPSGPIPLSPGHVNQQCVHHYRDPRPPHKHRTIRDLGVSRSGHTFQGTEAQDNREAGRTAVRQGEDKPREPTLQEALTKILGAYPGDDGPDTGQDAGEPAAAGGTVPGDQEGLEGHQHHPGHQCKGAGRHAQCYEGGSGTPPGPYH
ncbi:hypothetical protein NDU88_005967 [Pleurodeles waltl]|uniref:Uncharacterized protein n=1 Tax=Pleurodeles waltl TaxID=8319 RepID=A0AAV7PH39_PLEWA|nr:hypothetical protein NDU88_005967 [Pleurodeles waltl]